MKQSIRFFTRPATFINQLQWSQHHWFILGSFFTVAAIETIWGAQHSTYTGLAHQVEAWLGLSSAFSMAFVIAAKLALMTVGAFILTAGIWFVGDLFGKRSSRRVLFRRLAVVFTVVLAGYLAQHMATPWAQANTIGYALYAWGMVLGFFAIREQFGLGSLESMVVGIIALLMVSTTWQYATHMVDEIAQQEVPALEMAKDPVDAEDYNAF